MPAIYEHRLTVTDSEIDRLGHVNNVEYIRWMIAAALAHSAVQGWSAEAYEELGSGFVVRAHEIKYVKPAFAGDEVVVRTWVSDFRRMSSRRRYRIMRSSDEALLASAATEWAFVDFGQGSLCRIPQQVQDAFEIVADEP